MAETFGQTLRKLRRSKGISQRNLAEKVGVDFTYISKVENDRLPPPAADTIIKICKTLSVPPENLLSSSGKMPTSAKEMIGTSSAALQFIREAEEMNLSESEWEQLTKKLKRLRHHLSFVTYLDKKDVDYQPFQYTAEDIDVMAKTIWGEARKKDEIEKIAIAYVIKNRADKSPAYNWANTPKGVCLQFGQFSCWDDDAMVFKLLTLKPTDLMFKECLAITEKVLSGEIADPIQRADHYHLTRMILPHWARGKTPVATIGDYCFYRFL